MDFSDCKSGGCSDYSDTCFTCACSDSEPEGLTDDQIAAAKEAAILLMGVPCTATGEECTVDGEVCYGSTVLSTDVEHAAYVPEYDATQKELYAMRYCMNE